MCVCLNKQVHKYRASQAAFQLDKVNIKTLPLCGATATTAVPSRLSGALKNDTYIYIYSNKGNEEIINLILMCAQNYILISETCRKTAIHISKNINGLLTYLLGKRNTEQQQTKNVWLCKRENNVKQLFGSFIPFENDVKRIFCID